MAADPIAAIQGELNNLAARRQTLEARKTDAEATLVAARSARKNTLARDPTADLASATRFVRDGEEEVATIAGVLVDLADEQAAVEARLAQARDQAERAAAAKTLEATAVKVEDAAVDLEKALALVGKAFGSLVASLPNSLHVVDVRDTDGKATALAAIVLAEGIARHCPGAMHVESVYPFRRVDLRRAEGLGTSRVSFDIDNMAKLADAMSADAAAKALISARLRERAAAIIAGKSEPNLMDRFERSSGSSQILAVPQTTEVLALEDVSFKTGENDQRVVINRLERRSFLVPIAKRLIDEGAAVAADSDEAKAALRDDAKISGRPTMTQAKMGAGPRVVTSARSDPFSYRDLGIISPNARVAA